MAPVANPKTFCLDVKKSGEAGVGNVNECLSGSGFMGVGLGFRGVGLRVWGCRVRGLGV